MLTQIKNNQSSIYPGEYYTPSWAGKEFSSELKSAKFEKENPGLNIFELAGEYKIEIALPGVNREDLIVDADGCLLTVSALKHTITATDSFTIADQGYKPDSSSEYVRRTFLLPADMDPSFAAAEYKNGKLNIFFLKNNFASRSEKNRIIVY